MVILRTPKLIGSLPWAWPGAGLQTQLAPLVRRLSRAAAGTLGLIWALTMAVGGGLMLLEASGTAPWLRTTLQLAGATGVIAGVFVFQVLVADRLYPGARRRVVRNVEASLGVALMVGLSLTLLTFLT